MADQRFFTNKGPFTLARIMEISGCEIAGNSDLNPNEIHIDDILPLEDAEENHISFLSNTKYMDLLKGSKARACFMDQKLVEKAPKKMICLVSRNPHKSYALATQLFYADVKGEEQQAIHPTAIIDETAVIGEGAQIDAYAIIEAGVEIGNNAKIGAYTHIKSGCVIGDHFTTFSNVTLSHSVIGSYVTIYPGARIGQSGFGYAMDPSGHVPVPQLGRVKIGNGVEIGANTTIDRGSWKDTVIGDGCVIDNLVMIAHNVVLGRGCVIVAQAGIAGSTKFGDFVVAGGQSGFGGHIEVGSGVQVGAQAGVTQDVAAGEKVNGTPALPLKKSLRKDILLKKLANNEVSFVKNEKKENP